MSLGLGADSIHFVDHMHTKNKLNLDVTCGTNCKTRICIDFLNLLVEMFNDFFKAVCELQWPL